MARQVVTRVAVQQQAQISLDKKSFSAPVKGWVTATNLSKPIPDSAIVLDNWRPTLRGAALRGGSPRFATIDESNVEPTRSLMNYVGGSVRELFAADETQIFDITSPSDPDTAPAASVTGQTSGYYSSINFATTGGNFMICVNGTDDLRLYDGEYFFPIDATDVLALDYDAETGTFTNGLTVTGGTSTATGVIVAITDDGTTGTLYMNNVSGTFQNDEAITDSSTGAADADGVTSVYYAGITDSGVTTNTFSHVNNYRYRLYFVESGTFNVHYLPVDSIGGELGTLNLSGTFTKGGAVHFTATWSQDSGAGLDDKLVVMSTEGEVAVFQGVDPSDADTWSLVGVYDVLPSMGFNSIMRAGGDLVLATEGGMVPISAAVTKDPSALSLSAISRAIEPDWLDRVVERGGLPWEIVKWPEKNIAYVSLPVTSASDEEECFVVNLETGAWGRYTGWNTRCLAIHNDQVYFGSNDGTIKRAEIGGFDDESTPYVCKYAGSWDELKSSGVDKSIAQVRSIWRTSNSFSAQLSGSINYATDFPPAPDAVAAEAADSLWDVGLWDEAVWDVGAQLSVVNTRWTSVGKSGFTFSPQIQVTVGGANTPTAELVTFDVTFIKGALVV